MSWPLPPPLTSTAILLILRHYWLGMSWVPPLLLLLPAWPGPGPAAVPIFTVATGIPVLPLVREGQVQARLLGVRQFMHLVHALGHLREGGCGAGGGSKCGRVREGVRHVW